MMLLVMVVVPNWVKVLGDEAMVGTGDEGGDGGGGGVAVRRSRPLPAARLQHPGRPGRRLEAYTISVPLPANWL